MSRRRKEDRNQRLYKFWLEHPKWTYKSIAGIFHISAPRAWLIINEEHQKAEEARKSQEVTVPI